MSGVSTASYSGDMPEQTGVEFFTVPESMYEGPGQVLAVLQDGDVLLLDYSNQANWPDHYWRDLRRRGRVVIGLVARGIDGSERPMLVCLDEAAAVRYPSEAHDRRIHEFVSENRPKIVSFPGYRRC
jgi:hypothetical protein